MPAVDREWELKVQCMTSRSNGNGKGNSFIAAWSNSCLVQILNHLKRICYAKLCLSQSRFVKLDSRPDEARLLVSRCSWRAAAVAVGVRVAAIVEAHVNKSFAPRLFYQIEWVTIQNHASGRNISLWLWPKSVLCLSVNKCVCMCLHALRRQSV